MLDLSLFLWVMLMMALGLRRPFIWVLAYLYIKGSNLQHFYNLS